MIEMGNGAAGNSVCSEQAEGKQLWKRVTKRTTYRDGHKTYIGTQRVSTQIPTNGDRRLRFRGLPVADSMNQHFTGFNRFQGCSDRFYTKLSFAAAVATFGP